MGRVVKIAVIVLGLWAAMEFHNKGMDGAFGGLFATTIFDPIESATPQRAQLVTERAKAAAEQAFQLAEERRNRMLGE